MPAHAAPVAPGEKRRTGNGHVDSYGDDRVCDASGCATVLSRYNGRTLCWRHETRSSPRGR
jgi:hypothetical protein